MFCRLSAKSKRRLAAVKVRVQRLASEGRSEQRAVGSEKVNGIDFTERTICHS
jgi:hypothetical protein